MVNLLELTVFYYGRKDTKRYQSVKLILCSLNIFTFEALKSVALVVLCNHPNEAEKLVSGDYHSTNFNNVLRCTKSILVMFARINTAVSSYENHSTALIANRE